jgi:hypothetical protein
LLADGYHSLQILGGKPGLVAAFGRDRLSVSSSLDVHVTVRDGLAARTVSAAAHVLGNSVGAIGWRLAQAASKLSSSAARVWCRAACGRPFPIATLPGARAGSRPRRPLGRPRGGQDSYLVDSASSHMLVSKIKPCMCQYKHLYRETANGSLNQLSFI